MTPEQREMLRARLSHILHIMEPSPSIKAEQGAPIGRKLSFDSASPGVLKSKWSCGTLLAAEGVVEEMLAADAGQRSTATAATDSERVAAARAAEAECAKQWAASKALTLPCKRVDS